MFHLAYHARGAGSGQTSPSPGIFVPMCWVLISGAGVHQKLDAESVQFDSTLMMSVPFDSTLIVGQIEESSGDRCAVARLFFFCAITYLRP